MDEATVWVRRQYDDADHQALYRLADVAGWHLSDISGGRQAAANRNYWHGYVMCDGMIEGEVGHSCVHGPAPHRIKVCVVKRGNESAWPHILRVAVLDRTAMQLRDALHKLPRERSLENEVVDCIATRKFSGRALGEKRVARCRRVPIADVERAWQSFVGAVQLSPDGLLAAKQLFEVEINALSATAG